MLNGTLTPYERHCLLEGLANLPDNLVADVKKLVGQYGRQVGAGAPCRRLLKHFAKEERVVVGQIIPPNNVMFTLCKHLLLADRATEALLEDEYCIGCSCLAETYFMPEGCRHRKLSPYRDRFMPHTLCGTCSLCMRCTRLLDWIIIIAQLFNNYAALFMQLQITSQAIVWHGFIQALQNCSGKGQASGVCYLDGRKQAMLLPFHCWPFWPMEALSYGNLVWDIVWLHTTSTFSYRCIQQCGPLGTFLVDIYSYAVDMVSHKDCLPTPVAHKWS